MIRRIRQAVCSHNDTYEEWTEIDRHLLTVTTLRTLWRCERCGKEIRKRRNKASNNDTPAQVSPAPSVDQFGRTGAQQ